MLAWPGPTRPHLSCVGPEAPLCSALLTSSSQSALECQPSQSPRHPTTLQTTSSQLCTLPSTFGSFPCPLTTCSQLNRHLYHCTARLAPLPRPLSAKSMRRHRPRRCSAIPPHKLSRNCCYNSSSCSNSSSASVTLTLRLLSSVSLQARLPYDPWLSSMVARC